MARTKVANSFLADKVYLRADHLPEGEVTVLDCYAGQGLIWRGVAHVTGRRIRRLPIEMTASAEFHLPGDNRAYLGTIDLARFNVVDLDAYGVPYEQLRLLFKRGYRGTVFATFIQIGWSSLPHAMLLDLGFTDEMIMCSPVLCSKSSWEHFLEWLALRGVPHVWHRTHERKHYMAFTLNGTELPGVVG